VEAGNAAAKAGTLGSTVEKILADLKPEAAYFFADDNGNRSGSIVFDLKDSSQIPAVAEPWFLAFNAKVSFRPIMSPQDLAKAGPSINRAAFARADIATTARVIVFVISLSLRSRSRSKSARCPAAMGFNGAFLCFKLSDLGL
jgi:hypothetical protein